MNSSKTIVLMSGANQGIGYEISKKLATDKPSYHILMDCRSIQKGEAAVASLPKLSVEPIELDIISNFSISKAFTTVQERYGRLDVLINNAGIGESALSEGLILRQQYTQIMDTNAISSVCLTDAFVPLLHKSSHPRIVFMPSELGSIAETLDPSSQYYGLEAGAYKVSKAALNMIMATAAVRLKDDRLKINVCCPGLNATGLNGGMGGHPSIGAIIACRLATAGKDGETGTFTNRSGTLPW